MSTLERKKMYKKKKVEVRKYALKVLPRVAKCVQALMTPTVKCLCLLFV